MSENVSVLLPARAAAGTLPRAVACLREQTVAPAEVLIVLNDADGETIERAREAAGDWDAVRVIEAPRTNLAGALNAGLRVAQHELVARMDADDQCAAGRLERQAAFMTERPRIAAVGCAWAQSREGSVVHTMRPPSEPGALRARLLIENCLAHGSMMLRRSEVLAAGGYDRKLDRAQDYDLWLRLSRTLSVAALPEVLYTYALKETGGAYSGDDVQAETAAGLLVREWALLPRATEDERAMLLGGMCGAMRGDGPGGRAIADAALAESPSVEAVMAAVWARWRAA